MSQRTGFIRRVSPRLFAGVFSFLKLKEAPGAWVAVASYAPLLAWGPLLVVVTADYHRRRTRVRCHKIEGSFVQAGG